MNQLAKLVLVTGSGRSSEIGDQVFNILRDTYKLGDKVDLIKSVPYDALDEDQKGIRDRTRPLVIDRFKDSEVRVEVGKDVLLRRLRGTHVAFLKYLFDPDEGGIHVNRHLFEVYAFGRFLNKHLKRRGDLEHLTLVSPYLTYLRMHSVDKYIENDDFYQANTLELNIDILDMVCGIDSILTMDPHSDDVKKYCETMGMDFQGHNPFSSSRYTNFAKLGFEKEGDARNTLNALQPFINYFENHKEEYKDAIVIAPDDGSENRSEHFVVDTGLSFKNLAYMNKKRIEAGDVKLSRFKYFSAIKEEDVKGRVCILTDDMVASGNTAEKVAEYLHKLGAERVELWVTHAVCPEMGKIEELKYVNKIISLDSIIRENDKIIQVPATAQILSAQIYKNYHKGAS
ncbi:phosphoribosyltransferase family protein [Nanoarchaeota archaeon]